MQTVEGYVDDMADTNVQWMDEGVTDLSSTKVNMIILVIRSVTDLHRAQSRFVKNYTFYKPTFGPKYVSYRPYNEFITPTNFI